jgi:hypothetical protein
MSEQLDRLQSEVEQNSSATDSAITLLGSLSNRLRQALLGSDTDTFRQEISDLADTLDSNSNRLAAAVTANTLADGDSNVDLSDAQPVDNDEVEAASDGPIDFGTSDSTGAEAGQANDTLTPALDQESTQVESVDEDVRAEEAGDGTQRDESAA